MSSLLELIARRRRASAPRRLGPPSGPGNPTVFPEGTHGAYLSGSTLVGEPATGSDEPVNGNGTNGHDEPASNGSLNGPVVNGSERNGHAVDPEANGHDPESHGHGVAELAEAPVHDESLTPAPALAIPHLVWPPTATAVIPAPMTVIAALPATAVELEAPAETEPEALREREADPADLPEDEPLTVEMAAIVRTEAQPSAFETEPEATTAAPTPEAPAATSGAVDAPLAPPAMPPAPVAVLETAPATEEATPDTPEATPETPETPPVEAAAEAAPVVPQTAGPTPAALPRYETWLPQPGVIALPYAAPVTEPAAPVPGTDLVPAAPALPERRRGIGFWARGKLRRRARYLRRLRELQMRDVGGFVLELYRFGREQPEIVRAKIESVARTDRELRTLERVLTGRVGLRELREPGIGGVCSSCGSVHGSDARFCSNCGQPVGMERTPDAAGGPDQPR